MDVKILRRWGNAQPGETVSVDDTQGRWLVDHAFGTSEGVQAPNQSAAAPGSDGPDLVASGDGTRRRVPELQKAARRENAALPVDGAPRQFNAGVREGGAPGSARTAKREASDDEADKGPSSKVSSSGRKRTADA